MMKNSIKIISIVIAAVILAGGGFLAYNLLTPPEVVAAPSDPSPSLDVDMPSPSPFVVKPVVTPTPTPKPTVTPLPKEDGSELPDIIVDPESGESLSADLTKPGDAIKAEATPPASSPQPNSSVKPSPTPKPSAKSSEPKNGDLDGNGNIYIEGFGWVKQNTSEEVNNNVVENEPTEEYIGSMG